MKTARPILQRKRKTQQPCEICLLHLDRCICGQIPKLITKTKLCLIIHHRELKRTTNTGRLATHALLNSEMHIRGLPGAGADRGQGLDFAKILSPEYETYILYPAEGAQELEDIKPKKPVQLIVSDGNWRQASKLHRRHQELEQIPLIKISEKNLSQHKLRKEHFAEGFSTLEAIAIAFGHFENKKTQEKLLKLYQAKLKGTLAGRPKAK